MGIIGVADVFECKGIPLMEVFGLQYIGRARVKAENQFGTIKIISTSGEQYLYEVPEKKIEDVDRTMPMLIYRDDIAVSVKAPTCCFTKLCMEFNLFSGDYKGDIKLNYTSRKEWRDSIVQIPWKDVDFGRGFPLIRVDVEWNAKETSVTAEYETIFDAHQRSEFEILYRPFEDVTDDSKNY
ncbi:hypothetical protein POM88_036000 [Heracleum sosnowskyi]|uniref:Uncharacterized protein n=1 Tax=Heracleum sosnowskyi TaxID=360622 RepID=A0AAD8HNE7_9APIA|nr:hypothetical protein POM88_036000 [Heracleum sosnowskyi]